MRSSERESQRGWARLLLALGATLAVAAAPLWPASLAPAGALVGALVPVEQTMLLVVPAVAVCALVAWLGGGHWWLAVAWLALAAWVITRPLPDAPGGYATFARGWALLVAGLFGAVSVLGGRRIPLFTRALTSVGLAVAAATVTAGRAPAERSVTAVMRGELQRRVDGSLAAWSASTAGPQWAAAARRSPAVAARAADASDALRALPGGAATVVPALAALEALAALALGWTLAHRLVRERLGPPLGPLAEFRFNDQLVWGLVAGAALVAVPTLAPLRGVGLNLLVFFGALYALRGLGVLCWALGRRGVELPLGVGLVALGLVFPVFGGAVAALVAAAALALGLGDAWGGWRTRQPAA